MWNLHKYTLNSAVERVRQLLNCQTGTGRTQNQVCSPLWPAVSRPSSELFWSSGITVYEKLISWHLCLFSSLPVLLRRHGRAVQLCDTHGTTECTDLWGGRGPHRLQIHEGRQAVPGASHGQEEGGVWLVPTAQDLLRHDPEAPVHGAVQVRIYLRPWPLLPLSSGPSWADWSPLSPRSCHDPLLSIDWSGGSITSMETISVMYFTSALILKFLSTKYPTSLSGNIHDHFGADETHTITRGGHKILRSCDKPAR